jgi:O-antigen ligase
MKKIAEFPGGNNFADFLLIAICLGWFFRASRESKEIFIRSPFNIVILLYIIGSIINLVRGYTYMGFSEEIGMTRLQTWKNYMILPLLYFISVNTIDKEKLIKWIIIVICVSLIAMDFNFYSTFRWMRAEHYSHSIRISGPFSFLGPNELGIFFAVYSFLLLGISYFIDNKKFRYFLLLVCACSAYPLMFSYSRGAYICTIVGMLTLGFLKDRRIFILLAILIVLYSVILPNSVVERIDMTFLNREEITEEQEAADAFDVGGTTIQVTGRKQLWEKAMNYFESEPLLGIGFDTFRHQEGYITHSLYMKILAEQGLLGITIFIIYAGTLLTQSYRLFKRSVSKLGQGIGLGFFTATVIHLTGGIAGDQTLYYNFMAIFWVFMGIVARYNIQAVEYEAPIKAL